MAKLGFFSLANYLINQVYVFSHSIEFVNKPVGETLKQRLDDEFESLLAVKYPPMSSLNDLGIELIKQKNTVTIITFTDSVHDFQSSNAFKQLCEFLADNKKEYPCLVAVIEKISPMALEYSEDDPGIFITIKKPN